MKVRIRSLFNGSSIECPKCKIYNSLRPKDKDAEINSPEEAWKYPFSCKTCGLTYELGKIAIHPDLFESWFDNGFPGQPKPWEVETRTQTQNTSSPKDFEDMIKKRRDDHMRRILGF